ncbi:MAG: flagellar filament capping protein FliD [Fimbriimonadaceae bacterium]|nr:flagellar filament capping protein FliD [Fimbriimonadaceae bacterium]
MGFSLSGLNSTGIDFSALADALIQIERAPIDALELKKEQASSRKSMLNEVSAALKSLKTSAEALAKPKSLSFVKATSQDADLLGISATNDAALGTWQVTVQQLASSTRVTSGFATQLGISAAANLNANLGTAAANLGGGLTDGYVTINGHQIDINIDTADPNNAATNDTLQEVIDRINGELGAGFARYDAATDKLVFTSSSASTVGAPGDTSNFLAKVGLLASPETINGSDHERWTTHRLGRVNPSAKLSESSLATALGASGKFEINGTEVTWDAATDSLNDVLSRINSKVSSVVATYDAQTDKVVLTSRETGSLGITREDTGSNFLAAIGLRDNAGESQAAASLGQNAKLSIPGFNNGQPIYSTSNTVTDAIPGVSLTLKQADLVNPIEVSTARDTSDLKTKLRDFVTRYNEATNLIQTRLNEEPLENASSVTTRRVGLLRGDSMLARMRSQMAQAVTNTLQDLPTDFNRLGNLGVTIQKDGSLSFDETKFDEKIKTDFEQSYDVLFADDDGDGSIDDGEGGMVPRLVEALDLLIDTDSKNYNGTSVPLGDIARRNWTYDQNVKSYNLRIDELERQLEVREAGLRAKFLAAERAINQLSSNAGSLIGTG